MDLIYEQILNNFGIFSFIILGFIIFSCITILIYLQFFSKIDEELLMLKGTFISSLFLCSLMFYQLYDYKNNISTGQNGNIIKNLSIN